MAFQGSPGSLGRYAAFFRVVCVVGQPPKLGQDMGKPGGLTALAFASDFPIIFFGHAPEYAALEPALTRPGD